MAVSVEEAFAHCEARVKAHYENFPVGLFVPRKKRPFVYALYAFCRLSDDAVDLGTDKTSAVLRLRDRLKAWSLVDYLLRRDPSLLARLDEAGRDWRGAVSLCVFCLPVQMPASPSELEVL